MNEDYEPIDDDDSDETEELDFEREDHGEEEADDD